MISTQIKRIINQKEYLLVVQIMLTIEFLNMLFLLLSFRSEKMSNLYPAYSMMIIGSAANTPFKGLYSIILCMASSIMVASVVHNDDKLASTGALYNRIKKKKLIVTNSISVFIVSFFNVFLLLVYDLIISLIAFPMYGYNLPKTQLLWGITEKHLFSDKILGEFSRYSPYLNAVIFIILISILAAIFSLFTYGISFFINNKYVIMFVPLIVINMLSPYMILNLLATIIHSSRLADIGNYMLFQGFVINPGGRIEAFVINYFSYLVISILLIYMGGRKENI